MEQILQAEEDEDLRKAYREMLEGCLAHPEQREWYAMWMIEKTDGTLIGDLCFKWVQDDRNPEIGYGIREAFQGQGYATEAVRLALQCQNITGTRTTQSTSLLTSRYGDKMGQRHNLHLTNMMQVIQTLSNNLKQLVTNLLLIILLKSMISSSVTVSGSL